mgnify:CR=1 FL=1
MDLNIINTFLFHPRKSYQEMDEKDIQINMEDSVQVGARLHLINQSAPTIFLMSSRANRQKLNAKDNHS